MLKVIMADPCMQNADAFSMLLDNKKGTGLDLRNAMRDTGDGPEDLEAGVSSMQMKAMPTRASQAVMDVDAVGTSPPSPTPSGSPASPASGSVPGSPSSNGKKEREKAKGKAARSKVKGKPEKLACGYCGKQYTVADDLVQHQVKRHGCEMPAGTTHDDFVQKRT
jgi:hypothetical protein